MISSVPISPLTWRSRWARLYDAAYLPRKFKIGFAHEGDNCIDVLNPPGRRPAGSVSLSRAPGRDCPA